MPPLLSRIRSGTWDIFEALATLSQYHLGSMGLNGTRDIEIKKFSKPLLNIKFMRLINQDLATDI